MATGTRGRGKQYGNWGRGALTQRITLKRAREAMGNQEKPREAKGSWKASEAIWQLGAGGAGSNGKQYNAWNWWALTSELGCPNTSRHTNTDIHTNANTNAHTYTQIRRNRQVHIQNYTYTCSYTCEYKYRFTYTCRYTYTYTTSTRTNKQIYTHMDRYEAADCLAQCAHPSFKVFDLWRMTADINLHVFCGDEQTSDILRNIYSVHLLSSYMCTGYASPRLEMFIL